MKRLYISQPMEGKTDAEILSERESAIKSAERELKGKVEVIDSFFQNVPAGTTPLLIIRESIKLLLTADVVYFAKGWESAMACRIEHEYATEYGITIIEDNSRVEYESTPTRHIAV